MVLFLYCTAMMLAAALVVHLGMAKCDAEKRAMRSLKVAVRHGFEPQPQRRAVSLTDLL